MKMCSSVVCNLLLCFQLHQVRLSFRAPIAKVHTECSKCAAWSERVYNEKQNNDAIEVVL